MYSECYSPPQSRLFILESKLLSRLEYLVFFLTVNTPINENLLLLGLLMCTILVYSQF